jgi:hypothetical protein
LQSTIRLKFQKYKQGNTTGFQKSQKLLKQGLNHGYTCSSYIIIDIIFFIN